MSKHYALTSVEERFAEQLVANGRYANVDEVVREGLRLLREHEEAPALDLNTLRRFWREGFESGESRPAEEVFDQLEAKYDAMARERGA
jgi:antitoxin ParD1/3/4